MTNFKQPDEDYPVSGEPPPSMQPQSQDCFTGGQEVAPTLLISRVAALLAR